MKRAYNEIINNDVNDYGYKFIKTPTKELEETILQSVLSNKKNRYSNWF